MTLIYEVEIGKSTETEKGGDLQVPVKKKAATKKTAKKKTAKKKK